MILTKRSIFFATIIALAILSRLYKISSIPPALFSDEVDAGYQAYIFNTCRTDYYGRFWPLHFKSNSDFRTSLLIYSIAFWQNIFGVNELSTRFPSFLYGVLSIFIFYLLGNLLTKQKNYSLVLSFVAAINPYLIHFSRSAFEVSGMIFVILVSFYLFFRFRQSSNINTFLMSIFLLCLSPYFYSTSKLYVFLIFIIYLVFSVNIFLKTPKKLLLPLALFTVFLTPLFISTLRGEAGFRFSYISIFSEPTIKSKVDLYRQFDANTLSSDSLGIKPSLISKIFHNKYSLLLSTFTNNYLSSFSTNFLFINGDQNQRQGFIDYGYFYKFEFILPMLGILISLKTNKSACLFFLLILFISPLPFSLTRDSTGPHATRLILMTIPLIYFISIPFYHLAKFPLVNIMVVSLYMISFSSFFFYYLSVYPHLSAKSWHAGIKQAILYTEDHQNQYNQVYITDFYEPPLPFYLFYSQYQNQSKDCNIYGTIPWTSQPHFTGYIVDQKIHLGHIEWSHIKNTPNFQNNLYIATQNEFDTIQNQISPHQMVIIDKISRIYETQPQFIIFTIK